MNEFTHLPAVLVCAAEIAKSVASTPVAMLANAAPPASARKASCIHAWLIEHPPEGSTPQEGCISPTDWREATMLVVQPVLARIWLSLA
jgi:hypothetical protein